SAPETFALALFGLSIISSIAGKYPVKGFIMAFVGLILASVGMDPVGGFPRFDFGLTNLMSGVDFIIVMIGLFAASEAFQMVEESLKKGEIIEIKNKAKLKWH